MEKTFANLISDIVPVSRIKIKNTQKSRIKRQTIHSLNRKGFEQIFLQRGYKTGKNIKKYS